MPNLLARYAGARKREAEQNAKKTARRVKRREIMSVSLINRLAYKIIPIIAGNAKGAYNFRRLFYSFANAQFCGAPQATGRRSGMRLRKFSCGCLRSPPLPNLFPKIFISAAGAFLQGVPPPPSSPPLLRVLRPPRFPTEKPCAKGSGAFVKTPILLIFIYIL